MNDRNKMLFQPAVAMMIATMMLTGCEAVKGIFKAGMWVGVILAVMAVAGIATLAKLSRGS